MRHGASADAIQQCDTILREGLRRFRPILLCNHANEQIRLRDEFREWSEHFPEVRDHWPSISLYFADDGLVTEYLRGASPVVFRQKSDRHYQ
jgi:hypothetical protein